MTNEPKILYVEHIPDLITWDDYEMAHARKTVRFRVRVTDEGIELVGDSPYPQLVEEILAHLGPNAIEMMLCG
jgi:hypothetical protein